VEDTIQVAGPVQTQTRRSWRAISVVAALALVLGGLVLARGSDTSAFDKSEVVTNIEDGSAVVDGAGATIGRSLGFGAAPQAQFFDICGIIRPILLALANSFGGFLRPLFNSLLVGFGCASI